MSRQIEQSKTRSKENQKTINHLNRVELNTTTFQVLLFKFRINFYCVLLRDAIFTWRARHRRLRERPIHSIEYYFCTSIKT